jgi:hypothetical protein
MDPRASDEATGLPPLEETILSAIRMVKGVQSVVPIVSDFAVHIAESRARTDYARALMDSIKGVLDGSH